ncbi:MAG: putative selenate reductase subunit YgfK [Chloroflexi bacterium]|nr:putative selenate reductase subunit YgfK [Chloroflexota bacterium]
MSDKMRVQPFDILLSRILTEYQQHESIFGIHRSLFYTPRNESPYAIANMFGQYLATPIGPGAGPHTQLAQNILCAWLSGGRFIELKTVQIMDELQIPRPCIDMEDEGYNVEWSQELKLDQSAYEYIKAWALIHILRRLLGFEDFPLGTIFNMSVGYNLEGIQSPPMTRFMDRLVDASEEIAEIRGVLRERFPQFADVEIPSRLTNNVTLSTMHGCPPDEIERIARYLLVERGLHTIVKLNPTLLGKEMVMRILHEDLGYGEIQIPDAVFEHDLQYDRAVTLIRALQQVAAAHNLTFGIKLSNTLAMTNHKGYLPGNEMYMSGRALYPITMNLFYKLSREFNGDLNVSYSAGADAFNVTTILAAGAKPVTAVTDLLKPGGYSRLLQYLERLEADMRERGVASLDELARDKLANLEHAAADALRARRYKKQYHPYGLPKVESGLELFDCVAAPCVEQCAVCQDVPEYTWWIAQGEYDRALEVILARNPLPGVTGYVCTHLCQTRCTRNNYDEPVAIRTLKRFAAESGSVPVSPTKKTDHKVAIIGSGPSGLAAAYFLALKGVQVTIFEAKDVAGGMLAIAPHFRLPPSIVQGDIDRIAAMGVAIRLHHPITTPPESLLQQGFDAVYVACGFQKDAPLRIEGIEGEGVFGALDFLGRVARGERLHLGSRVLVIGGGNTAMDAARTAQRLSGRPATVLYRRTRAEMPAAEEEIEALLEEGNILEELVSPLRVIRENGHVAALECIRNRLGEPEADGRRKPVPIPGSEFKLEADSIIVAIGQAPDVAFLHGSGVSLGKDGTILVDPKTGQAGTPRVYAGGDIVRGPATVIEACADGRRAAEAICAQLGIAFEPLPSHPALLSGEDIWKVKRIRARKELQHQPEMLPVTQRGGFDLVEHTLTESVARSEAARCLQCSTLCDKCVEVCPNRANYTYLVSPVSLMIPQLSCRDGKLTVAGTEPFQVKQVRQIIHVDDFCNECGNCATFCVHAGKPYQEKPRLFLQESDFAKESDNAFVIRGSTIRWREGGQESRLTMMDDGVEFENARVKVRFSPDFQVKEIALKEAFAGILSLREAAEMALILKGVTASLPFLLV